MTTFVKDPDATLDFAWDWSSWLASGETISDQTVTVPSGLTTAVAVSQSSGVVTVWLSGGTVGESYAVACLVTTSDARIDERTMTIKVRDR